MDNSRTLRRAAARKATKEARKAAVRMENGLENPNRPEPAADARTGHGGPRTPAGKAKSCLNNLRHGLTGQFRVLDSECQEDFDAVLEALREEHQPITATEDMLVSRLAEHAWLSTRAQGLQDAALTGGSPHNLALFLRYQTTNDRGFFKCLNELAKLRKEHRQAEREFESQNSQAGEFVSQNPEEAELKRQSAIVAELRDFIGDAYPTSDEDLMTLFRGSVMHCSIIMRQKAGA